MTQGRQGLEFSLECLTTIASLALVLLVLLQLALPLFLLLIQTLLHALKHDNLTCGGSLQHTGCDDLSQEVKVGGMQLRCEGQHPADNGGGNGGQHGQGACQWANAEQASLSAAFPMAWPIRLIICSSIGKATLSVHALHQHTQRSKQCFESTAAPHQQTLQRPFGTTHVHNSNTTQTHP